MSVPWRVVSKSPMDDLGSQVPASYQVFGVWSLVSGARASPYNILVCLHSTRSGMVNSFTPRCSKFRYLLLDENKALTVTRLKGSSAQSWISTKMNKRADCLRGKIANCLEFCQLKGSTRVSGHRGHQHPLGHAILHFRVQSYRGWVLWRQG